ncbi:hypothetical protein CHUAL_009220 [Chamberlinius hualienensis]
MSTTEGNLKVLSKETKTTTQNGITKTTVTEVIQLPDGTKKTSSSTTTTTTTRSHYNSHQDATSHKDKDQNGSANENRSSKLSFDFSKLLHIKGNNRDNSKNNKSSNLNRESSPKIGRANSSSESDSSDDDEDFAKTCLKWHNNYRHRHGVPPLTLSKSVKPILLNTSMLF